MHGYDAKDMARSFRTVRANTIKTAEEIPEEHYGFRPSEGSRSVAETLAHIACSAAWPREYHSTRPTTIDFAGFMAAVQRQLAAEAALTTKAAILDALRAGGEEFATWLESVSDQALADVITYPAGMQPPTKTRFEMLLSAKEHEMHHRGQLMIMERMLGIVPHLTRDMQARMAQVQAQMQQQSATA